MRSATRSSRIIDSADHRFKRVSGDVLGVTALGKTTRIEIGLTVHFPRAPGVNLGGRKTALSQCFAAIGSRGEPM
jgi:hypothetical protein